MGPDGFTTVSTVVQIYNGYSSNLVTYESSHSIVYSCGQNYRKKDRKIRQLTENKKRSDALFCFLYVCFFLYIYISIIQSAAINPEGIWQGLPKYRGNINYRNNQKSPTEL